MAGIRLMSQKRVRCSYSQCIVVWLVSNVILVLSILPWRHQDDTAFTNVQEVVQKPVDGVKEQCEELRACESENRRGEKAAVWALVVRVRALNMQFAHEQYTSEFGLFVPCPFRK